MQKGPCRSSILSWKKEREKMKVGHFLLPLAIMFSWESNRCVSKENIVQKRERKKDGYCGKELKSYKKLTFSEQ